MTDNDKIIVEFIERQLVLLKDLKTNAEEACKKLRDFNADCVDKYEGKIEMLGDLIEYYENLVAVYKVVE